MEINYLLSFCKRQDYASLLTKYQLDDVKQNDKVYQHATAFSVFHEMYNFHKPQQNVCYYGYGNDTLIHKFQIRFKSIFYKTSGKVKLINLSHSHLHCNKMRNSNKCEHFSST